ncbi:MAG: quinolinate synthase NadA [Candidatus Thermoplasmatota archaeon]
MVKENIVKKINTLKEENDAVVLAHNYQLPEIQDVADLVGDSLDLAKKATKTENRNIVFCGVDFMAEAAKILNPSRKVIIPDIEAECPMAAMAEPEMLQDMKEKHPEAAVVAYINTTADVKALADICCTSSNGVEVVESLDEDKIIFVPDQNLGLYIKKQVEDKEMILWPGMCLTHHNIRVRHLSDLKDKHPEAEILVHPECRPEVIDYADYAFSTNGMVNHSKKSDSREFIIGTEKELCYRLRKENPDKKFYPVETAICKNMKKITLDKLVKSLESLEPEVKLSEELMEQAKTPLSRMMEVGRGD